MKPNSTAPLPPRAVPRPSDQSARWYEEARRFGRIAPERGGALRPRDGVRDNVIATGGSPGRLVICSGATQFKLLRRTYYRRRSIP